MPKAPVSDNAEPFACSLAARFAAFGLACGEIESTDAVELYSFAEFNKLIGFEEHRLKKEDFRNDAVDAAELAAEVFHAKYAEIRVGSGALANLYGFMALAKPGDSIIAPPGTIGGHVTHHAAGCAGECNRHTDVAGLELDAQTFRQATHRKFRGSI